ncbi:MAG: elongation factor P [Candidatus Ancillula sp.]|jgi:elongation factor P|nr:elongation factor P [Candidatus Ancillula sp.]
MATSNDIKNGTIIHEGDNLWQVIKFQHVKPGKGGAFVRTTQKNVMTGKVVDKTYNAGAKVEFTNVDRQSMQFSYKDGDDFVFMNMNDYSQVTIPGVVVGEDRKWLVAGETEVTVAFNEGQALFIELPLTAQVTITYTENGLQGDRSNAGTKPANFENDGETFEIQVPLFVNTGDKIEVDTRSGEYKTRVK